MEPKAASPAAILETGTEYQYIQGRGKRWTSSGTTTRSMPDRKKHGLDFRTAAKVFLDPHVIEFDDRDVDDEPRFNATCR